MKSGCINFVDFVDKLVSRLAEGDHHTLKTNHVTWLLAQIIRIELVMTALNSDSRKVVNVKHYYCLFLQLWTSKTCYSFYFPFDAKREYFLRSKTYFSNSTMIYGMNNLHTRTF